MSEQRQRKSLLNDQAMRDLRHAKRQIMDAIVGKVPDQLALATVQAAVRLARREAAPREVLSKRVLALVRQSLMALRQQKWKVDTALLLLNRHIGEPGSVNPRSLEDSEYGLS